MNVHLPNKEKLQSQVDEFNSYLSAHCKIVYTEETIFPFIYDGEIHLNERTNIILLLFSMLLENPMLDRLAYLYLAINVKIDDGQYNDATYLLERLKEEFIFVKNKIPSVEKSIYLNFQVGALLAHELCHHKMQMDSDYKITHPSCHRC